MAFGGGDPTRPPPRQRRKMPGFKGAERDSETCGDQHQAFTSKGMQAGRVTECDSL